MEINRELLACYLDGTATDEERNLVRKYLCDNPSCYEEILGLIERSTEDVKNVDEPNQDCETLNASAINCCIRENNVNQNYAELSFSRNSTKSSSNSIFNSVKKYMYDHCHCSKEYPGDVSISMQVKKRPKSNLNKELQNMLDELDDII